MLTPRAHVSKQGVSYTHYLNTNSVQRWGAEGLAATNINDSCINNLQLTQYYQTPILLISTLKIYK